MLPRAPGLLSSITIQGLLIAVVGAGTAAEAAPIEVFRDFGSFSAANPYFTVSSFDELAPGTRLGNPASVDGVLISNADPSSEFGVFSTPAYIPVSPPNVLAPEGADNILSFADTTLHFGPDAQAAGVFLLIGPGSNSRAHWVSTVTVSDRSGQAEVVLVDFQGEVGESRFVGFSSPAGLESIRFTRALRTDGAAGTVVAMDNLTIARSGPLVPVASLDSSLADGYAPLWEGFAGTRSYTTDSSCWITDCNWSFGDGTSDQHSCWTLHVYAQPGAYTATLTVTDNLGRAASSSIAITAKPNPGPVPVVMYGPASGSAPLAVFMDGTRSYAVRENSWVAACRWDFGDGSAPDTRCWALHAYRQPGHYTTRFTVADEQGVSNTRVIGIDAR